MINEIQIWKFWWHFFCICRFFARLDGPLERLVLFLRLVHDAGSVDTAAGVARSQTRDQEAAQQRRTWGVYRGRFTVNHTKMYTKGIPWSIYSKSWCTCGLHRSRFTVNRTKTYTKGISWSIYSKSWRTWRLHRGRFTVNHDIHKGYRWSIYSKSYKAMHKATLWWIYRKRYTDVREGYT